MRDWKKDFLRKQLYIPIKDSYRYGHLMEERDEMIDEIMKILEYTVDDKELEDVYGEELHNY